MPLYLPSFDEIMAVAETRGEDSDAPHLWRGLAGSWPMQEPGGVTVFDASGRNNPATMTGMSAATDRVVTSYGRAIEQTTYTEYLAWARTWDATHRPLTWVWWYSPNSIAETRHLSYTSNSSEHAPNAAIAIEQVSGATHKLGLYSGSYTYGDNFTLSAAPHHFGVSWDAAGNVAFYYDGKPAGSGARASGGRAGGTAAYGKVGWLTGEFDLTGKTWLLSIYTRILTPAEIAELYADPWAMYRLRTVVYPAAVAEEPSGFKPYWARPSYKIIGGGI